MSLNEKKNNEAKKKSGRKPAADPIERRWVQLHRSTVEKHGGWEKIVKEIEDGYEDGYVPPKQ